MKWLIILLLIFLLFMINQRYKQLEKLVRKALQSRKFRLPNEIIVDMARIPAAKHQELIDWFKSKKYEYKRKFIFGSEAQLYLLVRKNNSPSPIIDLLTTGEDGVVAVAQSKVELDGGNFDDIDNNFLVLFPEQLLKLPSGINLLKPCKKGMRASQDKPNKPPRKDQADTKDSYKQNNEGQQSSEKDLSKRSQSSNSSCLRLTRTLFKAKSGGEELSFNQGLGPKKIRIALIDSKVNFTAFSNFEEQLSGDEFEHYIHDVNNDFDGFDFHTPDEHGTFMASIICDKYSGDSELLIRNYPFHDGNSGHLMDLLAAIYSASSAGVNIINLSLGYQTDINNPHLQRALKHAGAKNILVVCASGNINSNNDIHPYWPANFSSMDHVVSVAAVNSTGAAWKETESVGTNIGPLSVNFAAEGDHVTGLINESNEMTLSGTSCSAAVLTALASNILSTNDAISAAQLKARLISDIGAGTGIFPAPIPVFA